jgi:hypothetical protein
MLALEQNIYAFQYIPRKIQTFEMIKFASSKELPSSSWSSSYLDPNFPIILYLVKHKFKNEEVCLNFVKQDYYNLQFVPLALKTFELCLTAVNIDGCALEFVPMHLRNFEMCLAANKTCGKALEFVPSNIKNKEFFQKKIVGMVSYVGDNKKLIYFLINASTALTRVVITIIQPIAIDL